MSLTAADWERTMSALAEAPGFAALASLDAAALVWSLDGATLLYASPDASGEAALLAPSGHAATPLASRLRLLADGLAPRSGFRLERVRAGGSAQARSLTLACRVVEIGGSEALLTVILDAPMSAGAKRGEPGARPAEDPTPPAPDVEAAQPAARRRGRRFTWQADAAGRFLAVSPDLAAALGQDGAAIVGRRWQELVGPLVARDVGEPDRLFIRRREPWIRSALLWRDVASDRAVPVELSGAPLLDAAGTVYGYRGFGLVFPDEARPAGRTFTAIPPRPAADESPDDGSHETPDRRDDPAGAVAPAPGLGGAIEAAAALTGTAGETVFGVLRAWFGPQLREGASLGPPPIEPSPPPADATRDGSPDAALTTTERGALHEIARALGGGTPAGIAPETSSDTAEIVALPPPTRPRGTDPTTLLDRLPIGIVVLRDETPLFANRVLLDHVGRRDLPDLVAASALQPLLGRALRRDDDRPVSVALPSAAGEPGWFELRAAEIAWGEFPATLVSLAPRVDPAPAAEAEALGLELAQRERRLAELAAALDLAADGVVTLDPAARILSLSRSAEHLFGLSANEVVGDGFAALLAPEDHRAALACLEALRHAGIGAAEECEVRGRTRSGRTVPLSMRAGLVPSPDGTAFSVAFRDVTRFKRLEDDLREARGIAEKASANRAEFLARISHEIRTPLTAITGFAELMLEERFGPIGSERYRGYVRDIHGSGDHVISLVNDLLDLAKATSGRSELAPARLDLRAIVQHCVALSAPLAARERSIIRTSFPDVLPAAWADERSVRQIVLNVLSNAIRFTGAGGQVIVSTAAALQGEIVLSIRDTGPGMSEDEIEAALTPFRQVSATRRSDGTGLGLPLSKALTEANGGVFTITSAPAMGTLVQVKLPAAETSVEAIAAE